MLAVEGLHRVFADTIKGDAVGVQGCRAELAMKWTGSKFCRHGRREELVLRTVF